MHVRWQEYHVVRSWIFPSLIQCLLFSVYLYVRNVVPLRVFRVFRGPAFLKQTTNHTKHTKKNTKQKVLNSVITSLLRGYLDGKKNEYTERTEKIGTRTSHFQSEPPFFGH